MLTQGASQEGVRGAVAEDKGAQRRQLVRARDVRRRRYHLRKQETQLFHHTSDTSVASLALTSRLSWSACARLSMLSVHVLLHMDMSFR